MNRSSVLAGVAVVVATLGLPGPGTAGANAAGTAQVTGQVVDTATGAGLPEALVAAFESDATSPSATVVADESGMYDLTLPPGNWTICAGKHAMNDDDTVVVDVVHPSCEPGDPFGDQRIEHTLTEGASVALDFLVAPGDHSLTRVVQPARAEWVRADLHGARRYRAVGRAVFDVRPISYPDNLDRINLYGYVQGRLINPYRPKRHTTIFFDGGGQIKGPLAGPWAAWTSPPVRAVVRGVSKRGGLCMLSRELPGTLPGLPELLKVDSMRFDFYVRATEESLYRQRLPVDESVCYKHLRLIAGGFRTGPSAHSRNAVRKLSAEALSDRPGYAIGQSTLRVYWRGHLWRTLDARSMRDFITMPKSFKTNRTRMRLVFVGDDPRYPQKVVTRVVRFPYFGKT